MFKRTLITAALALFLLPTFAQHSLLYKISGKGLKQPSYLYGTIHMICPDDFFLSAHLKEAFSASKTIYLEMDMDDPEMMGKLMQSMQEKKDGYSLQNVFKPKDYEKLSRYFKDSIGMDVSMFKTMKPMILLSAVMMKSLNCDKPASYEGTFIEMAKEQQKPIEGLESMEKQVAVFDAIPDSTESIMIMDYINNLPKQKALFSKMVGAYKRQDITEIHEYLKESPELAGFEDIMVYDRNRNWIPVIEKAATKETTLIACGAMHLGGDEGVVSLLRKKGYTVEPVLK
ncbi:TraB/GumN family protein [Chitinophaga sp. SYP-B3965]|uniref:TraB/GumN family protein n=1 Tax=Chitinophaga sp. SYP-B3965 TaxID=2663120 RepID=UPI0012995B20|nr:TraB/GumN family protein [Chitinophaga sp. SYP-B3965]MRG43644.1 TraB/GumN family protein [Chitinophaga sp. SYP-B3965]